MKSRSSRISTIKLGAVRRAFGPLAFQKAEPDVANLYAVLRYDVVNVCLFCESFSSR